MNNLPTIAILHRKALDAVAALRSLSPHDQLAPLQAVLHRREVEDCLTILDRDVATLTCPKEREAAHHAAAEVRGFM